MRQFEEVIARYVVSSQSSAHEETGPRSDRRARGRGQQPEVTVSPGCDTATTLWNRESTNSAQANVRISHRICIVTCAQDRWCNCTGWISDRRRRDSDLAPRPHPVLCWTLPESAGRVVGFWVFGWQGQTGSYLCSGDRWFGTWRCYNWLHLRSCVYIHWMILYQYWIILGLLIVLRTLNWNEGVFEKRVYKLMDLTSRVTGTKWWNKPPVLWSCGPYISEYSFYFWYRH